jgi:hypothetical protein
MVRFMAASVLALGLAGCATSYVAPAGASTARVKFVADPGSNNNAYFLLVKPGPACQDSVGQSLARLGAAINRDGATEYEREVESGEDLRIFAHWIQSYNPYGYSYSCKVGASISLLPGREYELLFHLSDPCRLELLERDGSGASAATIEQRVKYLPVSTSRELCSR